MAFAIRNILVAAACSIFVVVGARAEDAEVATMNRFGLLVQPIGYGPSDSFTWGLVGQVWLDEKSSVVLEAMGNLYNSTYQEVSSGHHVDRSGNSYGLHYKRVVWRHVYLKAGVDARTFNSTHDYYTASGSFESRSTAVSFALGSQWRSGHFTYGVDWIGYTVPLKTEIVNERVSTDPDVTFDLEKDKNRITSRVTQALRVYVGATF